jgi:hypothetical protein
MGRELRRRRLDLHPAFGGLDPDLDPVEDPVHATLVPEVGEVGSPGAKALRREPEVERLRK